LVWMVALALSATSVVADTPANCTFGDIQGTWIFYESERSQDSNINCAGVAPVVSKTRVELSYPNLAMDQFGNEGTWTMVYNQGFEVNVNGRSYFAFSDYRVDGSGAVVSFCNQTLAGQGWSHEVHVRNWACLTGKKKLGMNETYLEKYHRDVTPMLLKSHQTKSLSYSQKESDAKKINAQQSSWVATTYPHLQNLSLDTVYRMAGGHRSRLMNKPRAQKFHNQGPGSGMKFNTKRQQDNKKLGFLPTSWDWRNVSGINYVSDVRNQGGCGSCYAFSSMGMLESRVRVLTGNTKQFTFSPQDIVDCSPLSQGCEGGFPYLVGGRYGKDYGVVDETCNPYQGKDTKSCSTKTCLRHYTAKYSYVGGYYGACSEEAMKEALVTGGPMSVSFEVYGDFMMYKKGVYHHTHLLQNFHPFELTNHAVLLVGYGTDSTTGEDFWTIKNSWGSGWGEGGYFRIRRGTDECAIESIAVEAIPIP